MNRMTLIKNTQFLAELGSQTSRKQFKHILSLIYFSPLSEHAPKLFRTLRQANSKVKKKLVERDRTRTCNPQIRSLVPYPLGHTPCTDKSALQGINTAIRCCKLGCKNFSWVPPLILKLLCKPFSVVIFSSNPLLVTNHRSILFNCFPLFLNFSLTHTNVKICKNVKSVRISKLFFL